MAKFLVRVSLTTDGVQLLRKQKASGRRAAVEKVVKENGGRIEAFYYAFGQDDVITIMEFPDNTAAAAMSLVTNASAFARTAATPLISIEEMDRAVEKAAKLPSLFE